MDAVTPKCPNCGAPVLPDWDWCQHCSYDPDSLMPSGWISPDLYLSEGSVTTAAPPKRRRSKRGRKAEAAPAPRPPMLELPANLAPAIDPITEGGASTIGRLPTPSQVGVVAPSAPPVPSAQPARPAPAPPAPSSAPTEVAAPVREPSNDSAPGSTLPSKNQATPAATPAPISLPAELAAVVPGGTAERPVYRVKATLPELIGAGVLLLAAAGLAYLTVRGILQVATGASTSALDNVATVTFVVVCAVVAFAAAVQGLALVRQRVELDGDELVAHNRFGRVQRVPIAEIYAIRLSQRQYATPRGLSQAIETPYLQRGDGSGFWLDALGGRSPGAGPSDQQLALFEELTAAVDRRRPPRSTTDLFAS
jgi:hypothetical protein